MNLVTSVRQALLILSILMFTACSSDDIQKFTLSKMLSISLAELCEEKDTHCLNAIDTQLDNCLDHANWRQYKANADDQAELERFSQTLYACITDEQGNQVLHVKETAPSGNINMFRTHTGNNVP